MNATTLTWKSSSSSYLLGYFEASTGMSFSSSDPGAGPSAVFTDISAFLPLLLHIHDTAL
jgi:hypothetical protein